MSTNTRSVYPQANPFMKDEIVPFLEQPLIAKLCTHNNDGSIHIVPIWFKYDDGDILFGTQEVTQKVRNIKRNSQVSVLIDTQEPTLQGVILTGHAELEYENVIPMRISIFSKYVGSENAPGFAERLASTWTPVIIRVKPDHIVTFDYSKGFGISSNPDEESTAIV
jgi:PPOX class probable F420-dependent enzyme